MLSRTFADAHAGRCKSHKRGWETSAGRARLACTTTSTALTALWAQDWTAQPSSPCLLTFPSSQRAQIGAWGVIVGSLL